MNKKLKHLSQDIRNGKLLEENIPQLFNYMTNYYYTNAGVRMAMHYYAFYEAFCDDENLWSNDGKNLITEINQLIRDNIVNKQSGTELVKAVQRIDEIRNQVMDRMNMLTAYTDIFELYEYVLNRLEYRFKDEQIDVDEEEFAKDVLRYIFDTEDNFIINEKIKDMVGQLPIRMTKQRYFDLLEGSIKAYLGADLSSLETYLYMLRTSAMIYHVEGMELAYPALWEKKEFLSSLKYKVLTKEEYDKAASTLGAAAILLESETAVFYSLQEIINEVYAILLCSSYAGMTESEEKNATEAAFLIIGEINKLFVLNEKKELSSEQLERFSLLEGVQEKLSDDLSVMEDALYVVDQNYRNLTVSLMVDQMPNVLLTSQKLLSNSLFIKLDEVKENKLVDDSRITSEVEQITKELTKLFEDQDRVITRAVMANTLNKMPVFFKDHSEVMDYVRYTIGHCTDPFEKSACVELIRDIMSE